jgi:hypothetical protein
MCRVQKFCGVGAGDREAKRGNEEGREDEEKREHVYESVQCGW